jgi:hypothetical protein
MDPYQSFRERGFGIFEDILSGPRVRGLLEESDHLRRRAARFAETTHDGPVRWLVTEGAHAPVLRGLQNAHRISRPIDDFRVDPAVLNALGPIIGDDIKTVVSTLFWKPPGEARSSVAYHQDSAFRKPAEHFRRLAESYVQFGVALDPHGPSNGGLRVISGSHKKGDLNIRRDTSVMADSPESFDLQAYGMSAADVVDIRLKPGDAVAWSAHLLHGSPPNTSATLDRRFLIFACMRAEDCAVGDMAFARGRPCEWPVQDQLAARRPSRVRPAP